MRTKTLLLTIALGAVSAASSMAQVYSVNAVGYVNLTLLPGFNLIANPLNASGPSTLASLIPVAADGAQFFSFTPGNGPGSGYATRTFDELAPGWLPDGDVVLAPGGGGFYYNNLATSVTVTFVGEVPQGTLSNPLPQGFSIKSSIVPQTADVNTLGLTGAAVADGDQIFKYTPGVGPGTGYSTFTYDDLEVNWTPEVPIINVGESFFLKKNAPATWTRVFSVN